MKFLTINGKLQRDSSGRLITIPDNYDNQALTLNGKLLKTGAGIIGSNILKKYYNITATLSHVVAASGNAVSIRTDETVILSYTAASGYALPDTVSVTGATGVWNKDAGTLTLSNPTGNVTFTIAGVEAASGYTVTVDSSVFYNTGNLARINGVEQELDGQKIYTFNNVNTFNIYSSTAMSLLTSGTGSIPETYNWSSGWAWSTDIEITQDSSCVVSNDN